MSSNEKPKVAPKVLLDEDVLKEMNRHYSSRLGEEVIGRECFSDPQLESHICNILAPMDGGQKCPKCGNIIGRPCDITCDVHHFCLAVYGVRLGIGFSKRKKFLSCVKHNLRELSFQELYDLVMERHVLREGQLEVVESEEAPKDKAQMDLEIETEEPEEAQAAPSTPKKLRDDDGNELVTVAEAARMQGLTHVAMFNLVKKGKIEKILVDRAAYVRRVDVENLRKGKGDG